MGTQWRRDQLPEPECPACQLRTWSCGTRWRVTQQLLSTLRAAGGISFAESSDSRARTLVESFCKAASGGPQTRALASARGGNTLCFKSGEQTHTQTTRVGSNGRSAEADQLHFLFRTTSSEEAGSGPTAGQPNQVLFEASEELDWLSLAPTCGEQSIG